MSTTRAGLFKDHSGWQAGGERWSTPQWLFDQLHAEFAFTLDPCCQVETAKCPKFYTPAEDGLAHSWKGERVYMNPPYGAHTALWVKKASEEVLRGCLVVVGLLPAWTDRAWFHKYVVPCASEVRYLKGRLRYGGEQVAAKGNTPPLGKHGGRLDAANGGHR